MATKPTKLPRWANGVGADVVEPTSGKKDTGWVADERPPAEYFNWLLELIYEWTAYLNDQIFTGLVKADNLETLGYGVKHADSKYSLHAAQASQDVPGTGNGWAYQVSSGGVPSGWVQGDSGQSVEWAIPVREGESIQEVHADVRDTSGGHTVTMRLMEHTSGGGANEIAQAISAGDGSWQTLSLTSLTSPTGDYADGKYYTLRVTSNSDTNGSHNVFGARFVIRRT